tara:strand:+ start:3237 stop:3953 length:717 start_codon:yes stop_codon:yes gene_type:complete
VHQPLEIQTSVWATQDYSIEETQVTLESATSLCQDINNLIGYLYTSDELGVASKIPPMEVFRSRFPDILFHRIDVNHENAFAFKVLEYDNRTQMHNYTNYKGLILGDWEDQLSRDAITSAYTFPQISGLPRLSMVTKSHFDSRRYTHLIWPLREKGKITELLVAARYQDIVVPSGIPEGGTQVSPDEESLPFILRGREIFRSVKTKLGSGMSVYAERKPIAMKIRQIMGDYEVNALVN